MANGAQDFFETLQFLGAGMAGGNVGQSLAQLSTLRQARQQLAASQALQERRMAAAEEELEYKRQERERANREREAMQAVAPTVSQQMFPQQPGLAQLAAVDPEFLRSAALQQAKAQMGAGQPTSPEMKLFRDMGGEQGTGKTFSQWYAQQQRNEMTMAPGRYKPIEGGAGGFFDTVTGQTVGKPAEGESTAEFKDVTALRKEYTGASKPWQESKRAFERIQATEPTGPGDIALITSYMKVLDPGSTVREGEFATARNAGGVSEQIRGMLNYLIRSGEMLSPEQRARFKSQAASLLQDRLDEQKTVQSRYRYIANQRNMDTEEAVPDYLGEFAEADWRNVMLRPPPAPPAPIGAGAPAPMTGMIGGVDPNTEIPSTPELDAFLQQYGTP